MKIKTLALATLSLLFFGSCKKDKAENCEKTMASIAGSYLIIKSELGSGGNFVDVDDRDACELDDHLILNANGTSEYKDDGAVCNPLGGDTGTWSITSDGKILVEDLDDIDLPLASITSFDCSTLVITASESGLDYRVTLKK